MELYSCVEYIEIVNKDRLLLGNTRQALELVDLSHMKVFDSIQIDHSIN